MFLTVNLNLILLPVFIGLVIWFLIIGRRINKIQDPKLRAHKLLANLVASLGIILMLFWFLLPHTAVLSTFGYPGTLNRLLPGEDVLPGTDVLTYLQEYNRALVRTIQVLFWFIFVFVWWFLLGLLEFSKIINEINGKKLA